MDVLKNVSQYCGDKMDDPSVMYVARVCAWPRFSQDGLIARTAIARFLPTTLSIAAVS